MTFSPDTSSLLHRLDSVVKAAANTGYYDNSNPPIPHGISSLDAFQTIPPTPILEYRAQKLADTVTDPSAIEWVVGPYLGQSPHNVPYAEDSSAAVTRNELFRHALSQAVTQNPNASAAVVATHQTRYFGAEMASLLVRMGVPAHLFVDHNTVRLATILQAVEPSTLIVLDDVKEELIPASVEVCVTVRQSQIFARRRQIDLYTVDELGLLGYSTDCQTYRLNLVEFHFERSETGRLIVTPLYNLLQPKLRIETLDEVRFKNQTQAILTLFPHGR